MREVPCLTVHVHILLVEARAALDERLREHLAHVSEQLERLSDAVRHLHFESGPPAVPLSELSLVEVMEARA